MENTTVGTKTRLDLHGIRHEEARRQTIRFIENNWGSTVDLKVITGHSQKMKQVVIEVIDEYGLEHKVGDYFGIDTAYITIPGGQS